jgi:hypothetical protein
LSGGSTLADEAHGHGGLFADPARRGGPHIPARRFVAALDAFQGHTSALKMPQRVVASKAAKELPYVHRQAAHESFRRLCESDSSFLRRIQIHFRDPLSYRSNDPVSVVAPLTGCIYKSNATR